MIERVNSDNKVAIEVVVKLYLLQKAGHGCVDVNQVKEMCWLVMRLA